MSSLDILAGRLPDGTVTTDPGTLREHAIDSWSLALLHRVRGDDLPEPAAVLFPARTGEVATILAWASQTGRSSRGFAIFAMRASCSARMALARGSESFS